MKIIDIHQGTKHLVATYKRGVKCSSIIETIESSDISIMDCQSEEADHRLIRHTLHCVFEQYQTIVVRTIDTDVLVLLISYVGQFLDHCNDKNIYAHMIQSNPPYYDITSAAQILGKEICDALAFM